MAQEYIQTSPDRVVHGLPGPNGNGWLRVWTTILTLDKGRTLAKET